MSYVLKHTESISCPVKSRFYQILYKPQNKQAQVYLILSNDFINV